MQQIDASLIICKQFSTSSTSKLKQFIMSNQIYLHPTYICHYLCICLCIHQIWYILMQHQLHSISNYLHIVNMLWILRMAFPPIIFLRRLLRLPKYVVSQLLQIHIVLSNNLGCQWWAGFAAWPWWGAVGISKHVFHSIL